MSKQDTIRSKLESKVFGAFGKTVTLISLTAPTYNTRGEEEAVSSSETTITIVPYNIVDSRQSYEAFGDLHEGELDAAVPYNISINADDKITMEGEDWLVKQIEPNYLPDNVVTIIRLTRNHDD